MVRNPRDVPDNCDQILLDAAFKLFGPVQVTKAFMIVEIMDEDGDTKATWAFATGTKTHHVYGMFEGFKETQLIGQILEELEE